MRPGQLFAAGKVRCPRCNHRIGIRRRDSKNRAAWRRRIDAHGWVAIRCEHRDCRQHVFVFCGAGVCGAYPLSAEEYDRLRRDRRAAPEVMEDLGILERESAA